MKRARGERAGVSSASDEGAASVVAAPDSNPSGSLDEETPVLSLPAKWNRTERSPAP